MNIQTMVFTEDSLKEKVHKNFEFLSRKAPFLMEILSSCQTPFSISVDAEGRVDADLGRGLIYGGDAYGASLSQVRAFEEKPIRLFPDIPVHKGDIERNLISHRYFEELFKKTDDIIQLPSFRETGHIPLLLLAGLGFGFHLKELLEKYEVQNLIILDIPAFFRLSLYTLDWEWVMRYFSISGRRLEIIVHDKLIVEENLDSAFSDLVSAILQLNPGVFYWGYYFEHLKYDPPMRVVEWFNHSPAFQELFQGYFDDELWSLRWTLEKFKKKIPLYYPRKKVPKGSVAFVLGAGPSLDPAIEKIREYQDRAVIFSCGSTISALQKAGIVPDFHVEIERTKLTYDTLLEVDRQFLKKTRLIANNPLWTDCFKLFKKGYMFLKLNDTGALLLEPTGSPIIWHTGPTVTAAGVALAAEFGFEEIYLFGVDLGSKDQQKHHSKLTNYYNPESMLSKSSIEFDMPVPGNFGGTVYTHQLFATTKYSIEQTIRKKGVKVYNTSDGALIEGAEPLPIEAFKLKNSTNKEEAIKSIEENFDTGYIKMVSIAKNLERLVSDFEMLRERVGEYPRRFDFKKRQDAVYSFTQLARDMMNLKNPVLYNLLYHNTHQWSQLALGQALCLQEQEREEFLKFFWELYRSFLKEAKREINKLLEEFG